jgi:hypothetical protein
MRGDAIKGELAHLSVDLGMRGQQNCVASGPGRAIPRQWLISESIFVTELKPRVHLKQLQLGRAALALLLM